jgi:hypothetical protein
MLYPRLRLTLMQQFVYRKIFATRQVRFVEVKLNVPKDRGYP